MKRTDARRLAEFALLLLLLVGGAKEYTRRLERAAERQILQRLGGQGSVQVRIQPRWGALGVWLARAQTIQVQAAGFRTAQIPFFLEPAVPAWCGIADSVQIVLEDFSLSGLPVHRLEATIPRVLLDSREAAFRLRIRLFDAPWGEGSVVLDEQGLAQFIQRRLPEVRLPRVQVTPSQLYIRGELAALLTSWRFEARGVVAVRDGRQIVAEQVQVSLEGTDLNPTLVQKVLSALNPILDIERDLRLGRAFIVERVEQGEGFIKLIGRATVPPRETGGGDGNNGQ
ncbi:MAG: hypothetical protein RMM06_07560 [Armatimonadota bacterium]|nr:hypothetical protein [bacterium]MCS7310173.1 hypothetical protein [Armatimonadota bacterium]MDW8103626.1 hypothetical protein [Armatimonadota bacterium]MDW8290565.1 hypothetical protein [Armatimonadota bacterium]